MYSIRRIINLVYGLLGLYIAFSSLFRQWQEGAFGNGSDILFYFMVGPFIGFSTFAAGLFLSVGQLLDFLNKKSALWFSRISYLITIIILIKMYFIDGGTYIWSEPIDFLVFSLLFTVLYVPVIIQFTYFPKLKHKISSTFTKK